MKGRGAAFALVGLAGFAVQLGVLHALTAAGWPVGLATAAAVESAVLNNFFWHERWTWRDRRAEDRRLTRLWRFHLSNGLGAMAGNVAITMALAHLAALPAWMANTIAVALLSVINFVAADRWVFAARAAAVTGALLVVSTAATAGELNPATLAAWNRHVAGVERDLEARFRSGVTEPNGQTIGVTDGAIHEWRGSLLVRGIRVNDLIDGLEDPAVLDQSEDVAEQRFLERRGDSLRVYLRLVRRMLITVTYDTEHEVTYVRRSPALATSRSMSTKIQELDGENRGFLWRLNSYWQYRQVGDDVQVDVLSVSLSRSVPWVAKPVAGPLMDRIGRQSMIRTLQSVERTAAAVRMRRALKGH